MPRKSSSKSKGLTKTQAKSVRAIARDITRAQPERKVFGFIDENRQLYHNKTDYLSNFLECKQGTADPNNIQGANTRLARIGDEFYLRECNMRLWLSNKSDRPNVMYKCYKYGS